MESFVDMLETLPPKARWPQMRTYGLSLSLDQRGCRLVQDTMDEMETVELKQLLDEIRGHAEKLCDSLHGNHVLQKVISVAPCRRSAFILDELIASKSILGLACDPFGCRVLERCCEHFDLHAWPLLLGALVVHAKDLSTHHFGNFVVQHMLEYGPDDVRQLLVCMICENLEELLAQNKKDVISRVIDKALTYAQPKDRWPLMLRIVESPDAVATLLERGSTCGPIIALVMVVQRDERAYGQCAQKAHIRRTLSKHMPRLRAICDYLPSDYRA